MLRRIFATVAVSLLLTSGAGHAVPERKPFPTSDPSELLDATSAWVIAAVLVSLGALLLLLDSENEAFVPVSP